MKPTNEHIEEQILLMLDGELNEADTVLLMDRIAEDPELGALLDAYRAVHLEADNNVFPGKESLLRKEPEIRAFSGPGGAIRWAAAAVLLIVAGIAGVWLFNPSGKVARPVPSLAQTARPRPLPAAVSMEKKPDNAPETAAIPAKEKKAPATTTLRAANNRAPAAAQALLPEAAPGKAIATLPTLDKGLAADPVQQPPAAFAMTGLPAPAAAMADAETELPAIAWTPLKDESLQGINELLERFKSIKQEVKETARALKEATFVIQLGNKEIAFGK